jgi:cell division protein FtsN
MDKFIKLLLEKENTVILPGFGAIVVENENTGALMFNEYLKFNDGKLDSIIVDNSNMDLQEAQNYIAKHIREIQAEIDKGEEYSIFGLGAFSKAKDGSILFSGNKKTQDNFISKQETIFAGPSPTPPKEENADLTEETQLNIENSAQENEIISCDNEQIVSSETPTSNEEETKEDESKMEESSKEPQTIPVAQGTVTNKKTTKENKYDAKSNNIKKTTEEKKKKKGYGIVFYLLLFILVLIAGGSTYIGLNYDEFKTMMGWDKFEEVKDPKTLIAVNEEEDVNSAEIVVNDIPVTPEQETELQEDEITAKEQEEEAKEIPKETISKPERQPEKKAEQTMPKTPKSVSASGNYFIIAGTFSERRNAENFVEELKSKGYPAEIIGLINNMHYVSVQSFASRSDASNALPAIQNDVPKVWIYKKP